jgi:hypothetical protein
VWKLDQTSKPIPEKMPLLLELETNNFQTSMPLLLCCFACATQYGKLNWHFFLCELDPEDINKENMVAGCYTKNQRHYFHE